MSGKQIVNASEGICFRLSNVVSLHQLNEERRVMSEEFNTWVHSEVLVRSDAYIFSINILIELQLGVKATKLQRRPLTWVRRRVRHSFLLDLTVTEP